VLPSFVQAMTVLDARLLEPDWRAVAGEVLRRAPQRSLVVLLTALDPAAVEHGLLPELAPLTARHQVLLASVTDPRVGAMSAERGDAQAVYDAAAGSGATLARQHTAARLQRAGVVVVEGDPAELAPRLADAYLALKAAGRL